MSTETKIGFVVGWLFVVAAAFLTNSLRSSATRQLWHNAVARAERSLQAEDYQQVRELEQLLNSPPQAHSAVYPFAHLLLKCATSRRLGRYGDPARFLYEAEETLETLPSNDYAHSLRAELAQEFAHINLYARAISSIERIPVVARTDSTRLLMDQCKATREALLRNCPEQLRTYCHERSGPSCQRLLEMLGHFPENPWYDETDVLNTPAGAATTLSSGATQDDRPCFLASLWGRAPQDARFHNAETARYEASNSDASDLLIRDSEVAQAITDFLRVARTSTANVSELLENNLAPDVLSPRACDLDPGEYPIEDSLHQFTKTPSGAVIAFGARPQLCVCVISQLADKVYARSVLLPSAEDIVLRDVTGDGIQEIILTSRAGSGGFLSAWVIDSETLSVLLRVSDAYHGGITFLNLDLDSHQEVLVSEATGERIVYCNQCPSRYTTRLFDFQPAPPRFVQVATHQTQAEMLLRTHRNVMGLSPEMLLGGQLLQLGDRRGYVDLLEELDKQVPHEWSNEQYAELGTFLAMYTRFYWSSKAFESGAAFYERVLRTLRRKAAPANWLRLRQDCHTLLTHCLTFSQPDDALEAIRDPWYVARIGQSEVPAQQEYYILHSVLSMMHGSLNDAYTAIQDVLRISERPPAEALGNLARYMQVIEDYEQAYDIALEALDLAVEDAVYSGITVDMMHLAFSAARASEPNLALDWCARALRRARSESDGGPAAGLLGIAAAIAHTHEQPLVGLALLDEAVAISNEGIWQAEGPQLLLLYGDLLEASGNKAGAIHCWKASRELAEGLNWAVVASAEIRLSQHLSDSGDTKGAMRLALRAFEVIAVGRRSVGPEEHKFAFLSNKKQVISWLLHLANAANVDATQRLKWVDSWKLQTFFDGYVFAGAGLQGRSTQQFSRVNSGLDRDTAYIDYFLDDSGNSMVFVESSRGVEAYPIHMSHSEALAAMSRIHEQLDVHDGEALGQIRSDLVPKQLESLLRYFHKELIGPLEIDTSVRRLIISPDEGLVNLPWCALIDDTGAYLIERFQFVTVPSRSFLQMLEERAASRPRVSQRPVALVVGALGPVSAAELARAFPAESNRDEYSSLARLHNAAEEIAAVSAILGATHQVDLLLDGSSLRGWREGTPRLATRDNLLTALNKASVVHIAAHGVFNRAAPLRSVVFLEDSVHGRVLHADDLVRGCCDSLRLVCLAACESGRGHGMPGAEAIGFARSFFGAGATAVLATTWTTDDAAAARVFAAFYSAAEAEPLSAALRRAQLLEVARHRHPYYWAGFSLQGRWQ